MGAVFGAASRAAFTFIIFAFEITRDYNSVLPLMLVTVIAAGISHVAHAERVDYDRKAGAPRAADHQDYEADMLQQMSVSQTMDKEVPSVPGDMWLVDLARSNCQTRSKVTRHQALVIMDSDGKLAGIITRADIFRALDKEFKPVDDRVGGRDSQPRRQLPGRGNCTTHPQKCCAIMSAVCQ